MAAYEAVLPDPASRLLTWVWPRWIPLDDAARALRRFVWLERELRACTLPALLVWGREDDVFDPTIFATRFKQLLPQAEGPHLVTGRHFLQEDSGPKSLPVSSISCGGWHERKSSIIAPPPLDGTRLAFVLAEDRLGHYAEFRDFFVRSFELDRVGLAQPGYLRAPSGTDLRADLHRPQRRGLPVRH